MFKRKKRLHINKPDLSRDRIAASLRTTAVKNGSYGVLAIVLVILIAVIINLICGKLPSNIRQIDISSNQIYEISDTSRDLLRSLENEIILTVITESDSMDERLKAFLDKYVALSDKVSMETIDPVLHPSVLTQYDTETDTIIVECQDTGLSQQIAFSDILVQSSSYYYTDSSSTLSSFDGEGQLTGAINQVIGQETKKIYCLTDHGETELSESLTSLMQKSGFTTQSYSLIMNGELPKDCDMLLINGPTSDISKEESETINTYIKGGGNVMILLGEQGPETGNLTNLLSSYEITQQKGYIADMERSYQGNYYYIFPNVTATGDLTSGLSSGMVLMANSRGFSIGEGSDNVTVSSLLETSQYGYAVTDEKETQGTYAVGAQAVYTAESDSDGEEDSSVVTGNLIAYGSSSMIDENLTSAFASLENNTLFMNSITSVFDDVDNLSIEAKSMAVQYNTVQHGGYISVFLIFIVPILVLIIGFVFWMKRRRA